MFLSRVLGFGFGCAGLGQHGSTALPLRGCRIQSCGDLRNFRDSGLGSMVAVFLGYDQSWSPCNNIGA